MASTRWATRRSTLQAKAGTHSFFAYATACVKLHGQRFTGCDLGDPLRDAHGGAQELLALISKAGLRPGLLLLDRGFYGVEIIRYLLQAGGRSDAGDLPWPQGAIPRTSGSIVKLMKQRWWSPPLQTPERESDRRTCVKRTGDDRHGRTKWDTWVYAVRGITPGAVGLGQAEPIGSVRIETKATGR